MHTAFEQHENVNDDIIFHFGVQCMDKKESSEHQNGQAQEQFLPSGNPSHEHFEHLTINMKHATLSYIYLFNTYLLHFKFAPNIPVHTNCLFCIGMNNIIGPISESADNDFKCKYLHRYRQI